MAQTTGGKVYYERRIKTGEFEHKHASAEFTFSVGDNDKPEDADALAARAHTLAVSQVHRALGLTTDKDKLAEGAGAPAGAGAGETTHTGKGGTAAKKKPPAPEAASDPAGMDVVAGATPKPTASADPAAVEDEWNAPVAAAVSDADLLDKIKKRADATKNPQAIRELIAKYAPRSSEIPADKRGAFLLELEKVPNVSAA